jgi:hypothetical protein
VRHHPLPNAAADAVSLLLAKPVLTSRSHVSNHEKKQATIPNITALLFKLSCPKIDICVLIMNRPLITSEIPHLGPIPSLQLPVS